MFALLLCFCISSSWSTDNHSEKMVQYTCYDEALEHIFLSASLIGPRHITTITIQNMSEEKIQQLERISAGREKNKYISQKRATNILSHITTYNQTLTNFQNNIKSLQ